MSDPCACVPVYEEMLRHLEYCVRHDPMEAMLNWNEQLSSLMHNALLHPIGHIRRPTYMPAHVYARGDDCVLRATATRPVGTSDNHDHR